MVGPLAGFLAGKKRLLGKFVNTQKHERRKFEEHLRKNKTHTQTKPKENKIITWRLD